MKNLSYIKKKPNIYFYDIRPIEFYAKNYLDIPKYLIFTVTLWLLPLICKWGNCCSERLDFKYHAHGKIANKW